MEVHFRPVVLVLFGGAGDLTRRKLVPALYNLFLDRRLAGPFAVVGVDRVALDDDGYRRHLREGVDQFSRRGKASDPAWDAFAPHLSYLQADLTTPATYASLARRLSAFDRGTEGAADHVFYLATAPSLIGEVARQLAQAGLVADRGRTRLVVEKPFGHDLASARDLNRQLLRVLDEKQVYRIDHYLCKETVQNILAFRFANSLFEPIGNRRYIDQVQITVAEQVGVGHRAGYYEQAGALRDMVQNHLLQILCCVATEPPVSFAADEVRNKKTDVLRAIRPIPRDRLPDFAVRGQYGPGWVGGQAVPGYRQEPGVAADSNTETFAALKLYVDNWRWQDVPFYLRTGKRLAARVSEVDIVFDPVPHRSFPPAAAAEWLPNRLTIGIQPEEQILLRFQAKEPGPDLRLRPVHMRFSYAESFRKPTPEAYETLLLDVIRGDATLFMRADQVEAAWEVVTPVLEGWAAEPPPDFPNYPAGSWGPEAADALLAREGHHWLVPVTAEGAREVSAGAREPHRVDGDGLERAGRRR
jgi:glucose-6-phosphate 1-dehydrogenase